MTIVFVEMEVVGDLEKYSSMDERELEDWTQ
jgi:hypothetical protein